MADTTTSSPTQSRDTKMIQVIRYQMSNSTDKILVQHSAEWCKPCMRLKEHMDALETQGKLTKVAFSEVEKDEARKGLVIPFFELVDSSSNKTLSSIQTSNKDELDVFLNFDMLEFDDNF